MSIAQARVAMVAAITLGLAVPTAAETSPDSCEEAAPVFADTAKEIVVTIRTYHYNPAELDGEAYRAIEQRIYALGQSAKTEDDFLSGFRQIWRDGPFSHVNLTRAQGSVEGMVSHLDSLEVGPDAVQLTWQGDTAVLAVNTMMGTDTITAIETAFEEITDRRAAKLIIDLRANEGGAFAIRPLIGHVLSDPYDAGVFVAQEWNSSNAAPPSLATTRSVPAWEGWSVRAFWDDAQSEPFIRVRLEPLVPVFSGPVYVLTSNRTASAAELATDALRASGRAIVIGEPTPGRMLSQRPYAIQDRFHFFLPIADYFSHASGRIEGKGIEPDIPTSASNALEVALAQ